MKSRIIIGLTTLFVSLGIIIAGPANATVYGSNSVERCDAGGHCILATVVTETEFVNSTEYVRENTRVQCNAGGTWGHSCHGFLGVRVRLWKDDNGPFGEYNVPNCTGWSDDPCPQFFSTPWTLHNGTHTWQGELYSANFTTLGGVAYYWGYQYSYKLSF